MMAGREPHEHGYSVWVSANYMYIVRGGDDPSGAFTQRHKVLLLPVTNVYNTQACLIPT